MSKTKVFKFTTYTNNFTSVDEVIAAMLELSLELKDTRLSNLEAFNSTYLCITRAVFNLISTGYFQNDDMMQKFDITFARYYFDALHSFALHHITPPAWTVLFNCCENNNLYQYQYMALGVNAHINNDLAFALNDMPFNNSVDYHNINNVLYQCVPEIITTLHEKNLLINETKNFFIPLYRGILYQIVKSWRLRAWTNYQLLQNSRINPHQIEQSALHTSKYFT